MSSVQTSPWLDPAISAYVADRVEPPDAILRELIAETAEATGGASIMQVSPHQGALLGLLVGISGARRAVEVGTFTGYSAICIARALPDDGRLLCCDISDEYTSIARRAWSRAGLDDRIELQLGPAIETLRGLPPDDRIDFAFIDADKTGYLDYVRVLVPLMRPGGLICVDNTLWSGSVAEPVDPDTSDDTIALIAFNDAIATDPHLESYVLPVGDGLTLIRKR
ncbi:MAG: class I SAM-dependent methyltransferase [Acidimicrobiia bacterium]|nr:class I SAM-dependent methyltransferase [Acidimicrobiia bacterium]